MDDAELKMQKLIELLKKIDWRNSIIFTTDSYKFSHFEQYPEDAEYIEDYIGPRWNATGIQSKMIFFGLMSPIMKYLSRPITRDEIDAGELFAELHGVPFNKSGWEFILNQCNGYIPVEIRAIPEGSVIDVPNAVAVIRNTVKGFIWPVGYIEASLLRSSWYGSSVATYSANCINEIKKYMLYCTDYSRDEVDSIIKFKLHDFGARGVTSGETAALGGCAHLVNSYGTDTVEGCLEAITTYGCNVMPGFSIPAAEHSTITSWGQEQEFDVYKHIMQKFGGKFPYIAIVSDSYDLENAVTSGYCEKLYDVVMNMGSTLVIRPDSGKAEEVIVFILNKLWNKYGGTINSKGFKVLNPKVRVIQGDGVNYFSIGEILRNVTNNMFSPENVTFGSGGKLLQSHSRDDWGWAIKACAIRINGVWKDVCKKPKTDPSKASMAGLLKSIKVDNQYKTVNINCEGEDHFKTIYKFSTEDGLEIKKPDFNFIRLNASFM